MVPPVGVTLADPLLPPVHDTLVSVAAEEVSNVGCVIAVVEVLEQLWPSVTVTVYEPAASPVAVAVVCTGVVVQLYENGGKPPVAAIVADPTPPLQATGVALMERLISGE